MDINTENKKKLDNLVDAVKYAQELEVCVDQLENDNDRLAKELDHLTRKNEVLEKKLELEKLQNKNLVIELDRLHEENDQLDKENAELAEDLKNCEDIKLGDFMPEFKRQVLEELEQMNAQKIKDWIVDMVGGILTEEDI